MGEKRFKHREERRGGLLGLSSILSVNFKQLILVKFKVIQGRWLCIPEFLYETEYIYIYMQAR